MTQKMGPVAIWRNIGTRYRLEGSRCKACNKTFFPRRKICPECHSRNIEAIRLQDQGRIIAHTVVYERPDSEWAQIPYALALVDLEGGVRIMTLIADFEPGDTRLKPGTPIRLVFRKIRQDGRTGVIAYGYKALLISPKE